MAAIPQAINDQVKTECFTLSILNGTRVSITPLFPVFTVMSEIL